MKKNLWPPKEFLKQHAAGDVCCFFIACKTVMVWKKFSVMMVFLLLMLPLSGCIAEMFAPTEIKMFQHHGREHIRLIKLFTSRLYAKNPKYAPVEAKRRQKIKQIFDGGDDFSKYAGQPSDVVLAEAFAKDPEEQDRVYLLGLGMVKSIKETYFVGQDKILLSGIQIPLERLKLLHHNLSQVNWRLKTYKDDNGELLFLSNAIGEDGYMNMGYEVIMTEILTMISDDIYMRGGLPGKYIFNMSTLFASLIL